jgi:cysteinyl-tRNA synthetase
MDEVLPLGLAKASEGEQSQAVQAPSDVLALVERRNAARTARDFATADTLRNQLASLGYEVRDGATGPIIVRR